MFMLFFFFCKQKTAYEMRISDWSSDVCSSDLPEKRNALSTELVEALIAGVEGAHAQDVPLLVLCGAGTNLSAGFDFTGYQDQSDGDLVLRMVRIEHLLQLIAGSPALTVASGPGRNFGAGVALFAFCKLPCR